MKLNILPEEDVRCTEVTMEESTLPTSSPGSVQTRESRTGSLFHTVHSKMVLLNNWIVQLWGEQDRCSTSPNYRGILERRLQHSSLPSQSKSHSSIEKEEQTFLIWESLVVWVMHMFQIVSAESLMLKPTKQFLLDILLLSRGTSDMIWRRRSVLWVEMFNSLRRTLIIFTRVLNLQFKRILNLQFKRISNLQFKRMLYPHMWRMLNAQLHRIGTLSKLPAKFQLRASSVQALTTTFPARLLSLLVSRNDLL